MMSAKLDNPVWFSLSETHQDFVLDYKNIQFYHPDYCPFGGFKNATGISSAIAAYATLADSFFVVGEKPEIPGHLVIKKEVVCLQMVIDEKIGIDIKDTITPLTPEHDGILYDLVNLVQPGYVVEDNPGAIKLYEKLGFTTRRKISFWNISR